MTTGKTIPLMRWTFVGKVMSPLFNMRSRLLIAFLPRSKHLLMSWLQSPFKVILGPKKKKSCHCFPICLFRHLSAMKWWDQMLWSYFFECWVLNQLFPLSSLTFIKKHFSSSQLSANKVVYLDIWGYGIFPGTLDSSLCFIQPDILHDVLCI